MQVIRMLGVIAVGAFALPVYAAQVYLDPETNEHKYLDTFYIPVRIDTQGECINAVRVAVAYNPKEISVRDVVTGDSIITLWTEEPVVVRDGEREMGRVLFEGGIPGGYCGRVDGDPGLTNVLAKLVVRGVQQPDSLGSTTRTSVVIEPGAVVYRNDGSGTPVDLTVLGAEITLRQGEEAPRDVWKEDIASDTISPEFFDVRLVRGPSEGNKYHYIVFSTTDKQSGIDHYEVLETDPERFGFLSFIERPAYWVPAESPYVLRDQHLHSKILVKALDKKGNERIAEYTPPMSPLVAYARMSVLLPLILLVGFVAIGAAIVMRVARIRRRTEENATFSEAYRDTHEV